MKHLVKIIFVQWYLFDIQEIPIVGTTAVLGGNGAGKSSILDGVQVVLAGGDKNKIYLNKGSNERSARTIREYCLGIVSDPNAPVKLPSRDRANTYIVLCFYDDQKDEHICAGVAIWATAAEPREDILGYFITKGAPLSVDDFNEDTSEGAASLPWARVKDRLTRRFRLGESLELPNKGPGDFTRKFYTHMSAEPAMPMSAPTVVKSLLSAISFKPINDPTKFVRENMLDSDHINIRDLSESLKFWRGLRDKAVKTSELISELSDLDRICRNVEGLDGEILHHEHASYAARIEMCYELASPVQMELDEINDDLVRLDKEAKELEEEKETVQKKLWEKQRDLEKEDVTQRIQKLEDERNIKEKNLRQTRSSIDSRRMDCLSLKTLSDGASNIPEELSSAAKELLAEADIDDLLGQAWPQSPTHFDMLVEKFTKASTNALPSISAQSANLWQQIVPLQENKRELEAQAAMLARKQAPIGKATRGLMELLAKNQIEATPLCDLIDVSDERWRDTIEAVLGNAREALIVPPEKNKARDAIRIYRYEGKGFRGSLVVNTTKTAEWENLSKKDSLAEKVTTDDPHARAFINLRLGNIICVEKESDLLQHRRAATTDLMLASGGTVTMMSEVPYSILGRQNREALRVRLSKLIETKAVEIEKLTAHQNRVEDAVQIIKGFVAKFTNAECVTDLASERRSLEDRIEELISEIELLNQKENTKLKQLITDLKGTLDDVVKRLMEARSEAESKREFRVHLSNFIAEREREAEAFEASLGEIREDSRLDPALASETLYRLRVRFAESENVYEAVINHIHGHLESRRKTRATSKEKVMVGLTNFLSKNFAQTFLLGDGALDFETFEQRAKFIAEEKTRLEETTLAEYETRAENALKEVEVTFRTKFISRLVERLGAVRDNIAGLNKILKNRPFHGEIYQFRCVANPELDKVIKFAKAIEEDRSSQYMGGLFDPANDPDSPHREAIEFINWAFQDDDAAKLVSDYRNYYVFDVEMFDRDGNKVANLKHRIAKGSGGENMAPFYVAIGSSLSASYRITKRLNGTVAGGMNLAPFDEAFSKLDAANCFNCLEFLKDTGLQVLLAAPDEKYPTLAAQVDTVVWVYRDGVDVEIETEFLSTKAHDLLRSDNPFFIKKEDDGTEKESDSISIERSVVGGT
ncbi:Uncharacterized protein YPO0396 [Geoalkalibacter ferrihydriticus]|uniref:SMC hinge domain-containing protein n=2 Tax=Geoalkalibacter ferrihydriticus TaxID=392333 RepID=A0A0C2HH04_9BACT|nr:SbcC/MukB-like Walker B domain-containing protein [Geoalkalibacter ferrihydriticus]KIH76246.1 hypothetical protein GFER_11540 [Geoalkalibacter ferrihydriticus DSM 17813]SDL24674.1 Uncharacterized protein YPO0396 [Geoalkalibacter ferrihydriticus]